MESSSFRIGIRLKNGSYAISEPKKDNSLKYQRHFGEYLQGVYDTIYEKVGKKLVSVKFIVPVIVDSINCYMEIAERNVVNCFLEYVETNEVVPCTTYFISTFYSNNYVETYNEALQALDNENAIDVINHILLSKANKVGQRSELNLKSQPIIPTKNIGMLSTDITGDLKIRYNNDWLPINKRLLNIFSNEQIAALLAFGVSQQRL